MNLFCKLTRLITHSSRRSRFLSLLTLSLIFYVLEHLIHRNRVHLPTEFSTCNCSKEAGYLKRFGSFGPREFSWCSSESLRHGTHQKVIVYSMFSVDTESPVAQRYLSLLRNISMSTQEGYAGWVVRIYHNIDYRSETHRDLCNLYCQFSHVDLCSVPSIIESVGENHVAIEASLISHLNPRMFRYLVMFDPVVDVFISRDLDSFIWKREIDAVEEWLQSNYTFHVMRDHEHHDAAMLAGTCLIRINNVIVIEFVCIAIRTFRSTLNLTLFRKGMWGAKLHQRRDLLQGLMRILIIAGQNQKVYQDQVALESIVWPVAKYDVVSVN